MERILAQNLPVRRGDRSRLYRLIILYIIWESHPQAVLITAMFQVGGTVDAVALGRLSDDFSAGAELKLFRSRSADRLHGHRRRQFHSAGDAIGAGFCVVGSQIGANAFASTFYPAAAHATGFGWALGIGRLGAIAGPMPGAFIVLRHWTTATVFVLGTIPSICASFAMVAMGVSWAAHGPGAQTGCRLR